MLYKVARSYGNWRSKKYCNISDSGKSHLTGQGTRATALGDGTGAKATALGHGTRDKGDGTGARGRGSEGGQKPGTRDGADPTEGARNVGRDNFGELFGDQVCPLCVGKGNTQRAYLIPEKLAKIVLHQGGGFPSARRTGGGQLPSTRLRGEQGEAPSKRSRGGKATRHHTTPHPFQTTPDRTTTHQSTTHRHSTPHLTTPGTPPHHTRHHSKDTTNRSSPSKKRYFSPENAPLSKTLPNPTNIDPQGNHHPRTLHPVGTRAPLYSKMTM